MSEPMDQDRWHDLFLAIDNSLIDISTALNEINTVLKEDVGVPLLCIERIADAVETIADNTKFKSRG